MDGVGLELEIEAVVALGKVSERLGAQPVILVQPRCLRVQEDMADAPAFGQSHEGQFDSHRRGR